MQSFRRLTLVKRQHMPGSKLCLLRNIVLFPKLLNSLWGWQRVVLPSCLRRKSACCACACWQVFYEGALPPAAVPTPCSEQLRDVAAHVGGLPCEVRGGGSREVQQMKLVEAELKVGYLPLPHERWQDLCTVRLPHGAPCR